MLLIMVERSWGISRKDGKYHSSITGIKTCCCKEGKLPKIGRSNSYRFEIEKISKGEVLLSHTVRDKKEKILLKRFIPGGYHPMTFDGGFKYDFLLI